MNLLDSWSQILSLSSGISMTAMNSTQLCSTVSIPYPHVPGIEILEYTATQVRNYSTSTRQFWDVDPFNLTGLNVCNVTVTYTHPGKEDVINLETWLPLNGWNGRFQASSGGGWMTGWREGLSVRASQGYAVSVTDGGHGATSPPGEWALNDDGSVNSQLLEDFASLALHELSVIGKAITTSFYGKPPSYSYWNGCSTGGRQGLMLAQRYPDDFDGIVAAAPAINWAKFIIAEYWPQLVMNHLGVYPELCEYNAIKEAAMCACDSLDGVMDKIISAPGLCQFDPFSVVGQPYDCNGDTRTITKEAAFIAQQTWKGPLGPDGTHRWYGLGYDASFYLLPTRICDGPKDTQCRPTFDIPQEWIRLFVLNEPDLDISTLSYEQYDALFEKSVSEYNDIIGTDNPNLSGFRAKGGKMITWHGLADEAIFPNGTLNYYERVLEKDPAARDFYRYFEAPGVTHCTPVDSKAPYPQDVLADLIKWVEDDQAPETLKGEWRDPNNQAFVMDRPLCQYPLVARYIGGDITTASSFSCETSF